MKKIISLLFAFIFMCINVQAKNQKVDFRSIIRDSGINNDSISVSIRDAENGKIVYALNDRIMMNPASVQKIITMTAAYNELGEDYKFSTELYSRGNDNYLIKLSGDPYLKYSDLKTLTKRIEIGTKNIFVDDSILDNTIWGEGWQWDDDLNPLMQKFGAYNLDKNLIKIIFTPSKIGEYAQISNPSKYPYVFINNVKTSDSTNVDIKRNPMSQDNTIKFEGTISRQTIINIPSNNIKRYFEIRLTQALEENRIYLKTPFANKKKNPDDIIMSTIEHDLKSALIDILKNSNNMVAETVFKLAGGHRYGETGSAKLGIKMFNDFCKSKNIDYSRINITDGSGVSKNNLLSADFISQFLFVNKNEKIMDFLPHPGEGTLTQRMLPIKESLKAKTGTLAGVSSIAGFLTTKKGHKYTFCIIQNDVKLSDTDKKALEDYIIREAYFKL